MWGKANTGEITGKEFMQRLGYQEEDKDVWKRYLDSIEVSDYLIEFVKTIRKNYKLQV